VNHGVVLGSWEATLFAKLAIPIHYDNLIHPADFELVKKEFFAQGLNYKFLEIGESLKF